MSPDRVEDCLRLLHEFVASSEFAAELRTAREEFFKAVGAPLPGEPLEELRLASFIEWFLFDRRLAAFARTPAEEYLRRRAEWLQGSELETLQGFVRSVHSIFAVRKRVPGADDLKDLYTGIKYRGVKRVPPTLGKGDMADLRLVPAGEEWFATDALCFHPYSARKEIQKALKELRKSGDPIDPLLLELLALNTRYERYPKNAKTTAYTRPRTLAGLPRA